MVARPLMAPASGAERRLAPTPFLRRPSDRADHGYNPQFMNAAARTHHLPLIRQAAMSCALRSRITTTTKKG